MFRHVLRCLGACGLSLVAGLAFAQEADDSLLEKALEPTEKSKAPVVIEDESTPIETTPLERTPDAAQPAPNPNAAPAPAPAPATPNVGGGGVVVEEGGAAVATPAPRAMFLPSFAAGQIDPFGAPFAAGANVREGESILLRGTGLGAAGGRVVLQVDRLIFDAQIVAWAGNGIHVVMPQLAMLGPTEGMIHVVRADGVVCDRMPVDLFPSGN